MKTTAAKTKKTGRAAAPRRQGKEVLASTKISPALDARIEALRESFEAGSVVAEMHVSRSDVLRAALLTGVTAMEKERPKVTVLRRVSNGAGAAVAG